MRQAEFVEKGITYVVALRSDGQCVYRDKAHLGGLWSMVSTTLQNTSIRLSFRRALAKICQRIDDAEETWNNSGM